MKAASATEAWLEVPFVRCSVTPIAAPGGLRRAVASICDLPG